MKAHLIWASLAFLLTQAAWAFDQNQWAYLQADPTILTRAEMDEVEKKVAPYEKLTLEELKKNPDFSIAANGPKLTEAWKKTTTGGSERINFAAHGIESVQVQDEAGTGFELRFRKNGKLGSYGGYKAGELDGPVIHFTSEGQLYDVLHFRGGKILGIMATWDKDGRLVERREITAPLSPVINKR